MTKDIIHKKDIIFLCQATLVPKKLLISLALMNPITIFKIKTILETCDMHIEKCILHQRIHILPIVIFDCISGYE